MIKFIAGMLLIGISLSATAQTTFISNLNQPTSGDFQSVYSNPIDALSFTTGNLQVSNPTVTISINSVNYSEGSLGPLEISLYNDSGGLPGMSLVALSGSIPTGAGAYTYTSTTSFVLATNTTYWLVFSSPSSTGNAGYNLNAEPNPNVDSGSTWNLGTSKFYGPSTGYTWTSSYLYALFSISGQAVPPTPPTIALSPVFALSYTNTTWPYILQENANLNSTNWVTVTNTILTSTNNNQIFVILPSRTGQMFYRLH